MFSKEGPHPWQTFKGGSRLEAEIQRAAERQRGVGAGAEEEKAAVSQSEHKPEV